MFWNVASARDVISQRKWSGGSAHLQSSVGCRKCALLAAVLLLHSCFFTHSLNQGGQTCSMEDSFAENRKHQRAANPVCSVSTNTVKNASFTLNDVQ